MSLESVYNFLLKRDAFLMRKGGKSKKSKSKKSKSGIHINPKNEGKFTEQASRAGMGVQEYADHVLANKENYDSVTVRRANFARNFGGASHKKAKKHSLGGRFSAYLDLGGTAPDSIDDYPIEPATTIAISPNGPFASLYSLDRKGRRDFRKSGNLYFGNGESYSSYSRPQARKMSRESARLQRKENRFDKWIGKNNVAKWNSGRFSDEANAMHEVLKRKAQASAAQKRYFGSPVASRASGGSLGFLGDVPPNPLETADYSSLTGSQAYDMFGTDTSKFNSALADAFITDQTGAATYDFRHYNPLFRNRAGIHGDNLNTIDRMFAEAGFGLPQRAALIASIIHESKGNPSSVDDSKNFMGLIQWSAERFPDFNDHKNDLEYQANKIINEIKNIPRGSWTDGAPGGTIVNHANEGRWNFMSAKTPEEAAFYLNKCYIRPYSSDVKKDNTANRLAAYDNRCKEARNIFDLYNRQL